MEVVRTVKNWQLKMKFLINHCPWVQGFGMTSILPFCTRSTLIQLSSTIHAGHHVNGNTLPPNTKTSPTLWTSAAALQISGSRGLHHGRFSLIHSKMRKQDKQ